MKKKKLPKFIKIMLIIVNILTIIFSLTTYYLNLIPFKYYFLLLIVLIVIDLIISLCLIKRKRNTRIKGIISSLVFSILIIIFLSYEFKTNDFFLYLTKDKSTIEKYLVVTKNNENYKNIKDVNEIGVLDTSDDDYLNVLSILDKKKYLNKDNYNNTTSLVEALYNDEVESFLIEESQEKILEENMSDYLEKTKILYKFNVETKSKDISKDIDITKNTFNIYISGIDTYGNILENARSDVNIVATINPITHKISLIDIPRDYYVTLYNKKGYKDKLTHAGIYGVETSIKSIEQLLDIDINYYVKFNFTSLIKIVDEIGGVDVYSSDDFSSGLYDEQTNEIYHYHKGYNKLNGKEALSFARERYSFNDGDRVRGKHQEALIDAILNKIISPSIIINYSSILDALKETFVTNLDNNNLRSFIKMQLNNNISYDIIPYVLNGENSLEYTYTYSKQKLYVMLPLLDSINEAKEIITSIY